MHKLCKQHGATCWKSTSKRVKFGKTTTAIHLQFAGFSASASEFVSANHGHVCQTLHTQRAKKGRWRGFRGMLWHVCILCTISHELLLHTVTASKRLLLKKLLKCFRPAFAPEILVAPHLWHLPSSLLPALASVTCSRRSPPEVKKQLNAAMPVSFMFFGVNKSVISCRTSMKWTGTGPALRCVTNSIPPCFPANSAPVRDKMFASQYTCRVQRSCNGIN